MNDEVTKALGQLVMAISQQCGVSEEEAYAFVNEGIESVKNDSRIPDKDKLKFVFDACKAIIQKGSSASNWIKSGFAKALEKLMAKYQHGGRINAFSMNDTVCPEGYEYVISYANGGKCARCMKKAKGGDVGVSYRKPYSFVDDPHSYNNRLTTGNDVLDALLSYAYFGNGSSSTTTAPAVPVQDTPAVETKKDEDTKSESMKKGGSISGNPFANMFNRNNGNVNIEEMYENGPGWNKRTIVKTYTNKK